MQYVQHYLFRPFTAFTTSMENFTALFTLAFVSIWLAIHGGANEAINPPRTKQSDKA